MMRYAVLVALAVSGQAVADEKGELRFRAIDDQKNIPERYRLKEQTFPWTLELKGQLPISQIDRYELKFPSPVESKYPENNTVVAEYYRPAGKGPFPAVIVLDILAGNKRLPQMMCQHLAQNGIAGLFVQMAYYGPRRPKEGLRMVSYDVGHTLDAVRQTVLDLRYAAAWLESRPEVDKTRLGVVGTSLGSFLAALSGEMEPRLGRVAVLLGGGGFVEGYYNHPQAAPWKAVFEAFGGKKESIAEVLAPLDPLTRADLLKDRKLLIVAAKHDEIVPASMAEALWKASGEQQILWLNAGHFSAILHLPTGLKHLVDHFGAP